VSKKRMIAFMAVSVVFYMAASFAHPVTPTLFKSLGLGDYMFGYALAAMMVVNFLFSPFWGKLNTFLSSRVCLLIGSIGYALGQFLFSIAQTELQFIIARAFAGLFTGGSFVSLINYVVNMSPDEKTRGVYLAAIATIQSVAGAFGYFVGGMLGEINVQYALRAQVIVLASCGVVFYFICGSDAKMTLSDLKFSRVVRESNPFAAFAESGKFMTLLLAFLFGMTALQNLGQTTFDQSFNYYIKDVFGFSSGYNGFLKAAMGIITLIANSTICIYLINHTDIRRSIIWVFALCSSTMLGIVLMNSVIPFLVMNVVFYAMSSITMPLLQNMAADAAKDKDSNLVMGFFNSMKSLGGIFGAAMAGSLYMVNNKYPFIGALAAFSAATVCAVLFYTGSQKAVQPAESCD
jgi:MFS family permease